MQKKKEAILRSQIENFQKILNKTKEEIQMQKQHKQSEDMMLSKTSEKQQSIKYKAEMFKHGGENMYSDQ